MAPPGSVTSSSRPLGDPARLQHGDRDGVGAGAAGQHGKAVRHAQRGLGAAAYLLEPRGGQSQRRHGAGAAQGMAVQVEVQQADDVAEPSAFSAAAHWPGGVARAP